MEKRLTNPPVSDTKRTSPSWEKAIPFGIAVFGRTSVTSPSSGEMRYTECRSSSIPWGSRMKMPHIGSEKYTLPSAGLTAPSFGLFSRLPWKLSAKTVALSMAAPLTTSLGPCLKLTRRPSPSNALPFAPSESFAKVSSPLSSLQAKMVSARMSLKSRVEGGREGSAPVAGIHTGPSVNSKPSARVSTSAAIVFLCCLSGRSSEPPLELGPDSVFPPTSSPPAASSKLPPHAGEGKNSPWMKVVQTCSIPAQSPKGPPSLSASTLLTEMPWSVTLEHSPPNEAGVE